ncbi:MAG: epoxyqueuosine reductase QueH [Negativicutes bacterium]
MRLLLHTCCGPCSVYPVKQLREIGYDVTGYFFNPNIHPYREFKHRLETLHEYAAQVKLELITDSNYALEEFLLRALSCKGDRCRPCYEQRLRQTARFARKNAFSCFSTTLLVSPYQKHELIKEVASIIAEEEGIPFEYIDFRVGWQEGVTVSKEMGLYRQPYCGCIFSEKERYYKAGRGRS